MGLLISKPWNITASRATGEDQASTCVILDDSWSNLQAANRLGFTTVLVGQNGQLKPENQLFIEELSMLPQLLPELWERD